MQEMPNRGALKDEQLEVLPDAGVLVEGGQVVQVGLFKQLKAANPKANDPFVERRFGGAPGLDRLSYPHLLRGEPGNGLCSSEQW